MYNLYITRLQGNYLYILFMFHMFHHHGIALFPMVKDVEEGEQLADEGTEAEVGVQLVAA